MGLSEKDLSDTWVGAQHPEIGLWEKGLAQGRKEVKMGVWQ